MSGRGRGRGRGGRAGGIQLPTDGGKSEQPTQIFQPPPDFPQLESKPVPYEITRDMKYECQIRKEFVDYLVGSEYYVKLDVKNNDIERYCDRIQEPEKKWESKVNWNWMPKYLQDDLKLSLKRHRVKELKVKKGVSLKRPATSKSSTNKRAKNEVDINNKLAELEKQEETVKSDEEDKDEEEELEELEEQIADEEMDEGTDYMNSYFDNGENYEEEDDNLDDGAIF
ncbi:unnamed protein product [Trichogramma brassicae]|uniref:DNA-directed RNA polymerase III subunit n=1 Tax=Trichogramma brassicae TaxID=86971 RepID=A0A6H5IX71_9HYME|nr:unnamed protein product [Trichogramma brassicae]